MAPPICILRSNAALKLFWFSLLRYTWMPFHTKPFSIFSSVLALMVSMIMLFYLADGGFVVQRLTEVISCVSVHAEAIEYFPAFTAYLLYAVPAFCCAIYLFHDAKIRHKTANKMLSFVYHENLYFTLPPSNTSLTIVVSNGKPSSMSLIWSRIFFISSDAVKNLPQSPVCLSRKLTT